MIHQGIAEGMTKREKVKGRTHTHDTAKGKEKKSLRRKKNKENESFLKVRTSVLKVWSGVVLGVMIYCCSKWKSARFNNVRDKAKQINAELH